MIVSFKCKHTKELWLNGKAKKFAKQSQYEVYNEVDGGEDDKMNRIIWHYSKGNKVYPGGN